jgi:Fibronectin type III domain
MSARRLVLRIPAVLVVLVGSLSLLSVSAWAAGVPVVSEEAVSSIGTRSVTVSMRVDPEGVSSTYYVEYGSSVSYGLKTAELGVGAGVSPVVVSVSLTGLQPGTAYHFRFVAVNAEGVVPGVDVVFTTYPSSLGGLPDGRVYEQVSHFGTASAEANWPGSRVPDAGLFDNTLPYEASVDGDAVTFVGTPSTGGSGRAGKYGNQYLASRAPQGGWSQVNIGPLGDLETYYEGFSNDLSMGFLRINSVPPPFVATEQPVEQLDVTVAEAENSFRVLYEHAIGEADYRPLFTIPPKHHIKSGNPLSFTQNQYQQISTAGLSADSSHVVFNANDALLGGEGKLEKELLSQAEKELAETDEAGKLHNESEVESEGKVLEGKALEKSLEALAIAGHDSNNELYVADGGGLSLVNVSAEGGLVPGASFGGSHGVSADGSRVFWTDVSTGEVFVREDASGTVPSTVRVSLGSAEFWTASMDGRYAYYTEAGKLWRFNVDTGVRVELAGSEGAVQGVVGTNETGEDGEFVYFVAQEALPSQENSAKQTAVKGEDNLYVVEPDPEHAGQSRILFIGALSSGDGSDWESSPGGRTAYLTPDGHALMFMSSMNLTGGSYADEGADEAYVFDADGSSLVCASCRAQASGASVPNSSGGLSTHRWISEDGNRVFFDSEAPLVSRDVNGLEDVYEWERDGTEGCVESTGCVFLISAGVEGPAGLVDASKSGNDVFFTALQRLVPEGQDEQVEVYDARVDGVPPVAPPECSGTGCQGAPAPAPIFATPSSVTFNGVGNFPPPVPTVSKTKSLTRSQKLARALKACRQKHDKKARSVCKSRARKLYGAGVKVRKTATRGAK